MQSIICAADGSDWEIIEECHLTEDSISNDSSSIAKDCDSSCQPVINNSTSEFFDDENCSIIIMETPEDDEEEDVLQELYAELNNMSFK
jgi:hypothetical protein